MISKQVAVKNETGLHARPAKEFVSKAKQFTSRITVLNFSAIKSLLVKKKSTSGL